MSKFQVGDKVEVIKSIYLNCPVGSEGYVRGFLDDFVRVGKSKGDRFPLTFYPDEIRLCTEETSISQPQSSTGAMREKLNTIPYDLVPFQEITDAYSRVAEFGAKKYDAWNWSKGLGRVQIICSLLRHTFAYLRGEDKDKDSGLSHTDHILWNAATLSHSVHWNINDDRRVEPEREYKSQ